MESTAENRVVPNNGIKDAGTVTIMNAFGLVQSCVVIFSLVAGATILLRIMFIRCRNFSTIFSVTLSGLFHCLYCVIILHYVKSSLDKETRYGCLDFYPVTILSNAIILLAITLSAMKSEEDSLKRNNLTQKILFTVDTVLVTLLLVYANWIEKDHVEIEHKPSIKIVKSINMYFTVCEKNIQTESYIFVIEYVLLYLPMIWILGSIIRQNYKHHADFRLYKFQILRKCCHDYGDDDCKCNLLNTIMQAILVYNGICLLLIRPILIIYSMANNELYRDILPSLTNTVMFVLLCVEHLSAEFKAHIRPNKLSLDKSIKGKDLKIEPGSCVVLPVLEVDVKDPVVGKVPL